MDKYYKLLDISPGASQEEIKSAYKKKAFVTHPDKNNGNDEEFKKVSEAYEILSGKRKASQQSQQQYPNFGFNPFEGIDLSYFFGNLDFGQGTKEEPRPPKEDSEIKVRFEVSIEDIKKGKNAFVKFEKSTDCDQCNGVGGKSKSICTDCRGTGAIRELKGNATMQQIISRPCQKCGCRGKVVEDPCSKCGSRGFLVSENELKFEIKERK